ncbi:MAG: hypothetical protein AAGG38_02170 [Planctomycetota bacterium]
MPSKVFYGEPGRVTQPSPSVWGDCPQELLAQFGAGLFVHKDFDGSDATLPGLANDGDAPTFGYSSVGDTVLDIVTGSVDNNAAAIFTRPLDLVQKNSGVKVWAEASIALAAVADQGVYFGLAELAALDLDVVADDAGDVAAESVIGFLQAADDTDAFDAITRVDAGATTEVLADVTNASAIPAPERASVAADTFVKLGVRFDGRENLEFYANGVKVASLTPDDTIDQAKSYGAILGVKTGAAASRTVRVEFFRAASYDTNA